MCRLWSKLLYICMAFSYFPAVLSCGFIDLRPIGFSIHPDRSETLLSSEYSPVRVTFDTAMDRQATEGVLSISYISGVVNGDISWTGNTLQFVPVSPWTAGTRYSLNFSGLLQSADGRELRVEKHIFFYAINKAPAPLVNWFYPEDGASVGAIIDYDGYSPEQKPVVEIRFSLPMDRLSTETAFSIEGVGDKKFTWSDDNTHLSITPEKNLSPWTSYRWTIKNSARSNDGVPLAKAVSARFITDLDKVLPCVRRIFPALYSDGRWLATGGSPETHLGPGQGIVIEFNKPIADSALNSIRFDPSLAGRTERLLETTVVFIPNRDPQPEISYTLIISSDVKDTEGLKMGEDYRMAFVADIPYLRILTFNADGAPVLDASAVDTEKSEGDLNNGEAFVIPVDIAGGEVFRFTIRFSLPFSLSAKQNMPRNISLLPLFPGSLAPVALRFVSWISDDRLRMEWEGLKPGTAEEPHFYRLKIQGGKGGIDTGDGMYLKENLFIILEAQ